MSKTTITVTLEVEVDEGQWASYVGAGDAYNEAVAQDRRSLVADVQDYVSAAITDSAAAADGAITDVTDVTAASMEGEG